MSKEVSLIFGKDDNVQYPRWSLGNTLITGKTATGKSTLVQNILEALVLQYTSADLKIMMYDGTGEVFISPEKPAMLRGMEICSYADVVSMKDYEVMLSKLLDRVQRGVFLEKPSSIPTIVVLHDISYIYSHMTRQHRNCLEYILANGRKANYFFIMDMQRLNTFVNTRVLSLFDYILCLWSEESDSFRLFGDNRAALLPRRRKMIMKSRADGIVQLNIPFYGRKEKIEIVSRNIAPHGAVIEDKYLKQFAALNGI